MLQCMRSIMESTARRWYEYNASGTSWTLPQEDVITYQEHLGPYTSRRCYNLSGTSWTLHQEDVTMYQGRFGSYIKTQEDVTTYQERLGPYIKQMLQRIRTVLEVTSRRCYSVSWFCVMFLLPWHTDSLRLSVKSWLLSSDAGTSEARTRAQASP